MSRNKLSRFSKRTGMGSNDSGSVKVDGFQNGEGDMSKRPKRKFEQAATAGVDVQADRFIATLNDGEYFETDGVAIDPSQVGVPADLPDYESPSYSSARIHMQAMKEASESPIPREDEARPCTLCASRRPIGKSYSRVYCTKSNARYCKCSYCGHTWTQERK